MKHHHCISQLPIRLYNNVFKSTGLKFKSPNIDTCRFCDEYNTKFKYLIGPDHEKVEEEKRHHEIRYKTAYESNSEDKK